MYYKKYYFSVYEFLEEQIHAFISKLSNRCFCCFPSAMLVPIRIGTSMAVSPYKSLNLGEALCIFTSIHFPDSGIYLLNRFDFYFDLF